MEGRGRKEGGREGQGGMSTDVEKEKKKGKKKKRKDGKEKKMS